MKRILFLIVLAFPVFLGSCIKNDPITLEGEVYVEFDATVLNTPLTGRTYPVLTRVPAYGAAVVGTNPSITRASGAIKFRVNLVGAQQSTDQVITFKAVTAPTLPTGVVAATSGTHYTITGTLTIPANSSFGEATVTVVNPGVSSATPVGLVLELVGNETVKPSENYKFLGVQISLS
jgi:hypothetical protein